MNVRAFATVVLIFCAGAADAAELGRLFFTPAQRASLDNARKQNIKSEVDTDDGEQQQQPAAAPVPQNVNVNGVIRRSDGKNAIWLNNRMVTEQQPGGINAAVGKNDNRVRLRVPESGRSVDLKVGQSVEIVSGTVEEGYLRRPTPKPDAKTPLTGENTGGDVPKVTAAPRGEAVKSEPALQKRTPRAVNRDARDDSRIDDGTDAK